MVLLPCTLKDSEEAFADHRYPSVRRAVLAVQTASVLSCFPEVSDVHLDQRPPPDLVVKFVEALSRHCPKSDGQK
ncbi:hypothetical protein M378DRAFT_154874 [Amanita muscaria Koide BX008]|uniref:Uncharacterized protein n=1 Tax=Amanita muscaria (strain Koide BX008) TaxID=946122 RepID=A0A0C2TVH2_AMAMK|nr:hypothetical protein M378DRAFT_154874 [Amanita muscaria Koide BX008]